MQKTYKDGILTKEYIDFVKELEREDLERFYMGADLYNYNISNDNERLNKKIEILEENNKLLIQQKAQLYEDLDIAYERISKAIEYIENNDDEWFSTVELIGILKGEDNEEN